MKTIVDQFLSWHHLRDSTPDVLRGFVTNLEMMVVAELFVLIWGLIIALARTAPGRAGKPLRLIAVCYIDLFRGVPLLLIFLLVGFGLPQTGLPLFKDLSLFWLSVLALTLAYGAYVAEVYRSGIESIHHGQIAAARSLGLSHRHTSRYVVLPQAIRRVIPPLLNDFISLQKDTALASTIGVLEGVRAAQTYAGNVFNVSSLVGVSLCFVIITIPLARATDMLVKRDQKRMRAASAA